MIDDCFAAILNAANFAVSFMVGLTCCFADEAAMLQAKLAGLPEFTATFSPIGHR